MYNQYLKFINRIFLPILLIIVVILFSNCDKENDCPEQNTNETSILIVSPENLKLSSYGEGKIYLSTYPATKTNWLLTTDAKWLKFSQVEGEINKNIIDINVTVDVSQCEEVHNNGAISFISSTAGSQEISVNFTVDPDFSSLSCSEEMVLLDFFDEDKSFYIKNIGFISLDWSLYELETYLIMQPVNGTLNPGDSTLITIEIDRTGLPSKDLLSTIQILTNKNDTLQIPVTARHYIEEKWILSNNVVEAEIDKANDKIIVICTDPPGVNILDPNTKTETMVPLPFNPVCLSLHPQGAKAIVGCENVIYYINTESAAILGSFETGIYPKDILYGPTDWAYVFEKGTTYNFIHNINLLNGETYIQKQGNDENIHIGLLHPSGNYIYAVYMGSSVSPSGFYKYSIEHDTTSFLYHPLNHNYSVFGKVWMSDDGLKIFTYGNTIARCSENQAYDLEYITRFETPYSTYTDWLVTNSTGNMICSIYAENTYGTNKVRPKLTFLRYDNYQIIDTVHFPNYFIDLDSTGVIYASDGYFAFFNPTGNKVYSLIRAEAEYPYINDWSVFICDIPELKNR